MHKSKIKQISLAVCLALMPLSNYAAGLGKLNVNSGIGEPLRAEIELLSVSPEELSTLAASIASEDAYAQQGIPHLGIHNNIKVDIAKNANGSPVLKIHSNQPVSDPYLDMLIQVDWATGRLQREYTVLLDPPGYKPEAASATPVTLPSVGESNVTSSSSNANNANAKPLVDSLSTGKTVQPSTKKTKKAKKAAAVKEEPIPENVVDASGQELTTQRGDTLSAIARETQVEGVSLDQMLVGLYESNKEAFDKDNMNRLKVGQIIKVPSKDVLTSIGQSEAKKTIKIHSANWNAYRNGLAANVDAAPAKVEAEQKQSSTGKIATAEDKATPVTTGPKDVVKLSAGDKAGAKNAKEGSKSAEAKIVALQEETTARENSLKEANDRASALEKQIADMQKLIAMKSQSMAEMQKNAEVAAKNPVVVEKPKEAAKVEEPKPVEAKPAEVKPEVAKPVELTPPVEVKPAEVAVESKPKVKKPVVLPPPVVEEPGFIAGLLSSFDLTDLTALGGAGGVALLGGGWMYLRNKRRKDLDSFERGILTSGGLRANTVFGNTTGNASMSDTSFLTDFAQSADGSMIDTNDVDPIAEAEVYMAYGRDAQAEEILKDAILKEPKRYELHLKLLELYAARKDTSAFETIAGELYTTLGSSDPTWAKVAAMGSEMEPSNPLYNLASVAPTETTQKLDANDFSDVAVAASSDLDFSFDDADLGSNQTGEVDANSAVMQSFGDAKSIESDISFDLGTADDVTETIAEEVSGETNIVAAQIDSEDVSSNLMDFDLGGFETETDSALAKVAEETAVKDAVTESFDLNLPEIDTASKTESAESSLSGFDMDFNLPEPAAEVVTNDSVASTAMEDISFDLGLPEEAAPTVPDMVSDATEIQFDLPSIEEPVIAAVKEEASTDELEVNAFDLSLIDLNLGDTESELSTEAPTINMSASAVEAESQDVNIKLDLVAAYIDMDDKEGALELLEEILKEGGPQQQAKAKELLENLA